ncbi:LysR family transcriptional regulator [Aliikangiella sp. IMCC44653]
MNQFEDMQAFVRIVEAGSITKAAEQLNMVKSAVSRRLNQLEQRLGTSLLTRTTRQQVLTEAGRSYYLQCLRIIEDVAEVEAEIKNERCALAGRIKVAAPLSFGLAHLSAPLRQFKEAHPDITFEVDFNDRQVDIVEEGFDVAIRIANLKDSSFIAKKITSIKLMLCASPSYLAQYGTPEKPQDLRHGHVKLHYTGAPETWRFKDSKGEPLLLKVATSIAANNGDFLCQAAIDGQGITLTPDFVCYQPVKSGQLKTLLANHLIDNEINAYAVYPHNRHLSLRVRRFINYLADYFGDTPYWRVSS